MEGERTTTPPGAGHHRLLASQLKLETQVLPGCINALGWSFHPNHVMPKQSMGQQCPSLSAALSHTSGQAGESSREELKRLRLKECRHVEL